MSFEERAVDVVFESVVQAALSLGHSAQHASEIAASAEDRIRLRLGGTESYIHAPDRVRRYAAIFADYDGRNRDEVCRKWGISRRTLYRIVGDAYGPR